MTKFLNNADVTGYISQTSVTSSLVKTDANGKLVAATAGTDYQAPTTALLPAGGTAGQILSKIDATNYNTQWIDNFASQIKYEVKLGAALTKGTPVYVSSANGTNMIVSASSNATEATSSKTLGLLETGGVLNDIVKVVSDGLLAGLDTSTALAGDPVWLGPSGTLLYGLANKPSAPVHMVFIGIVTRAQSVNGEIFVKVQNGFELEELHNVAISSVANNQGLFYESATSLWKNKTIAAVLGYTPVDASLTTNYIPKATGATTLGNSIFTEDGGNTLRIIAADAAVRLTGSTEYLLQTVNANGRFRIYDQTAAVERLTISSTGNVGIGSISPSGKLEVNLGALSAYFTRVAGDNGTTNPALQIGTSTSSPRLYAYGLGMEFFTAAVGGTGTLKMILDSSGNLGIGTSSPSARLQIATSSNTGTTSMLLLSRASGYGHTLFEQTYDSTYFTAGKTLTLKNDSGTAFIHFAGNNAGTQTNVLIPTGNVGIGTTSPTVARIQSTTDGTVPQLALQSTDASGVAWRFTEFAGTLTIDPVSGANRTIKFTNSGAASLTTIIEEGNLGLGVTPSAWGTGYKVFEFGNLSGNNSALFSNNVNDFWQVSNAYFDGTNFRYIATGTSTGHEQVNGVFKWYTAASGTAGTTISFTQAMTLFANGNLAVGTTTDSGYKLDVNGTGRFSGNITGTADLTLTSTGGHTINMVATTAGSQTISMTALGGGSNTITGTGGDLNIQTTGAYPIVFKTNSVENLRIASGGAATFSSSVSTGSDLYVNGNSVIGNSNAGISSAGTTRLTLQNTTLTNSRGIGFYANDGTQNPRSWIKHITASGSQYMEFSSDYSTASSYSNFIFQNGNVGIGTSSPINKLSIQGDNTTVYSTTTEATSQVNIFNNALTNGATASLSFRVTNVGSFNGYVYLNAIATSTAYATDFAIQHRIAGGGFAESLRIISNGNVLIGTTTDAGYKLDVNGTGRFSGNVIFNGFNNNIYSYTTDSVNGQPGLVVANGATLGTSTNINYFKTYNYAATTLFGQSVANWLFIGTEGSANNGILFGTVNNKPVIIGTNNTANLTIAAGGAATFSSSVTAKDSLTITGNYPAIQLTATSGTNFYIESSYTSNRLGLGVVGSSPIMSLLSGGNVGIGTTTPNYSLHINKTDGSFFIGSSTRFGYFVPQSGTQNISYLQMRYDDNGVVDSVRLYNNYSGAGFGQGVAMYGAGDKVMGSLQIIQTDTSNTEAKFVLNLRNADASSAKITVLGSGSTGIGTVTPVASAKLTVMGNQTFGLPGNGANTSGRFISIEGNTDVDGEGSSRVFFTEHNATTAAMDAYGMSLGYRGGSTSIVGASGNTWTGLSLISNGEWGMFGHNGDATGALIMYGDRAATFINLSNNNLNNVGNAYFNGSVGIGIDSTGPKLQILGSHTGGRGIVEIQSSNDTLIALRKGSGTSGLRFQTAASVDNWFFGEDTAGNIILQEDFATTRFTMFQGGNFVIGNGGDAGYKLDVNGTGRFSGITTFGSTGGSGLRVYGGSGTNQWDIYLNSTNLRFSDNTGTGSIVFDRPISGTSATFSGDITTSNNTANVRVNINNTTATTGRSWYLNSYSNGNLYVGNGTAGDIFNFSSTGVATFSSSVTATSFISDGGASEGSIRIERDTVGTSTVIGSLNFTNNNGATTYGKVFGGRNSAGDGYVALGTSVSNNLYALESGNVGIGTTSPSAGLEIAAGSSVNWLTLSGLKNGGSSSTYGLSLTETHRSSDINGVNHYGIYATPAFNTSSSNLGTVYGAYIRPTENGTYNINYGYGLYVENIAVSSGTISNNYAAAFMGGNVGIGTASPSYKLDILADATSGSSNGIKVLAGTNSSDYALLINNQANTLNRFVVRGDGLVGIGTSSPTAYLTIGQNTAGDNTVYSMSVLRGGTLASPGTYSTTPGILIQDISGDGPATQDLSGGLLRINASRIADGDTYAANATLLAVSNDTGSAFFINGKRYVGIGTTSPSQLLHVSGGYTSLNGLRISGSDTTNTIYAGNSNIGITAETGYNIFIGQTSNTTVGLNVKTNTGNVLIGTTTDAGLGKVQSSGAISVYSGGDYWRMGVYTIDGHGNGTGGNWSIGTNSNDNLVLFTNNTTRLTIANSGTATFTSSVTATAFYESSDATIKTLITDNCQSKGIESVVAKLYVKNGKEELGYFAQDVQGILPSAVSKGEDGLLSLSYREVHTAKIARLEKEVEELKAQLARL